MAAVKREIAEKLKSTVNPGTGEPMVLTVYDAAEIYAGKMMHDAPDLVVGYAPGYRRLVADRAGGRPAALVQPNDRKWSGDHCIEPSRVPGILFTSFVPAEPVASIAEVPKLIRASLRESAPPGEASRTAASTGYLDVASPALSWVDNTLLGWLPVWSRVVLWAAFASFLSMGIYRLTSRQEKLAEVKAQVAETRARLQGFEGEFHELWPILRRNLALAGKQLGMTFLPP